MDMKERIFMAYIKSWRVPRENKPDFGRRYEPYPATRFFDRLSFIGDESVACFLVETSEGLILIDCMWREDAYYDMIEKGIKDLGYCGGDLSAVLLTHGHPDHYGYADRLAKKYGARIYMSETDFKFAKNPAEDGPFEPIPFEVTHFLEDGQDFILGDTAIKCVWTPGHTPGCMSFIIPVTDEGRPHKLALWGGTGLLPESNKADYLASVDKFSKICGDNHADAEISNHPFVDNGIERLNVIRNICNGVANPFVIGEAAYKRYEDKFRTMCLAAMKNES